MVKLRPRRTVEPDRKLSLHWTRQKIKYEAVVALKCLTSISSINEK